MSLVSLCKRRILGKGPLILKKIALPILGVFLFIKIFSSKPPNSSLNSLPEVLPGEALDPLAPKAEKLHENKKYDIVEEKPHESELDSEQKIKDGYVPDDTKRMTSSWSLYKANIKDHDKVKTRGHAITNDTVTLTLMSSSDKVFMSLNKKEIYRGLEDPGIHVVVLNQYTGRVMATHVFDTHNMGVENEMVEYLDSISDGRIIIFSVRDDAAKGLTTVGRTKLRELGSRWIDKLEYRDMWAMVTRQGGMKLAETYSNVATADTGYDWGGPVFLRTDFDLESHKERCQWWANAKNKERLKFCSRYEGYGKLCNCKIQEFQDAFFPVDTKNHNELKKSKLYNNMAIAILSSNRPFYLYKTFKYLNEAAGLNKENIFIFCDDPKRELRNLVRLFGATLIETHNFGNISQPIKIRHKVQRVFRDLLDTKFPPETIPDGNFQEGGDLKKFEYVFLLHDDNKVAVDIFKYLYTVSDIFNKDKTVLGITAFNYQGHKDVSSSLTSFYRSEHATSFAILLPKATVNNLLAPNWLKTDKDTDWKYTLRKELEKNKDNSLIYPEVPRAMHFSYEGYMVAGGVQFNLFRDHIISLSDKYAIKEEHVDSLILENYEKNIEETLKRTQPTEIDFCIHDLTYGHEPKTLYVKYDENGTNWKYIMGCLKTWNIYILNTWKGVNRFTFHGHPMYIVSVPNSKYSKFKPANQDLVTSPPKNMTTSQT